ncbi:MAG: class I SAM-dependent methyltransferase [Gammaproteobacteria bacterium]|nr:class I SAM-dependent methyltransferase [Gammaproteobacteria bacterium]
MPKRERTAINYTGVELSDDALAAERVLDRVSREPNVFFGEQQFDLIICFHVLEHIVDPLVELDNWKRMLTLDGRVVVEVPNESGHPYIVFDRNPEHIHHFCVSSIASLMRRANFNISNILTGCFESPSYLDSIRLVAKKSLGVEEQNQLLLQQLQAVIVQRFDIYGIGGDFGNYILPLLPELAVDTLYDSQQHKHGKVFAGHSVSPFESNVNLEQAHSHCQYSFSR